jgi:CBS domain-containing protein
MNAGGILASKGNGVVTATADKSLLYIAGLLAQHRIGCIVIMEADKIAGIISERDLMRAIGQEGPKVLSRPVSGFMTTAVVTALKTDTQEHLMREMSFHQFRHIPVVDLGRLIGIVSIGDLVKMQVADAESESDAMRSHISSA